MALYLCVMQLLSSVAEFDELPVRHNEDQINTELARRVMERGGWAVDTRNADDPHIKANLLFQAHFLRVHLPLSDYITDTKNVLDQSIRIMQAMVDVMADEGWLQGALRCMNLIQMLVQGRFITDSSLMILPHIGATEAADLEKLGYSCLPELADGVQCSETAAKAAVQRVLGSGIKSKEAMDVCRRVPMVQPTYTLHGKREAKSPDDVVNGKDGGNDEIEVHVRIANVREETKPKHLKQAYCPRYAYINHNCFFLEHVSLGKHSVCHMSSCRFPKAKEDGWWLVIGDVSNGELIALKRLAFSRTATAKLTVPRASLEFECKLFLISDTYIGIDQELQLVQPAWQDCYRGTHAEKVEPRSPKTSTDSMQLEPPTRGRYDEQAATRTAVPSTGTRNEFHSSSANSIIPAEYLDDFWADPAYDASAA